jgi:hypothetical protein
METKEKKQSPQDFKKMRGSPSRRSLQEILQRGAGSSGAPPRDAGATSEPAVEVSAKGRVEPVVSNLPEVLSRTLLPGVSSSDTPLLGAGSSSIPAAGESLRHLASGVSLAKTRLSGCARRKLKKAKASQAGTGGIQQPGNGGMSKQGETPTGASKRPRSEDSTPTESVRPLKRPRDSSGPGTCREALTNIKIAILKENYPEDKLTEDDQEHILEELGRVFRGTPKGELPHLKSFRLEGGALMYVCADQQSGQWLIRAIDNHMLGSGARLKATDARNFPKPIKVALRTRDKVAKSPEELLKWIKDLNPGLQTEHWMVLDTQPELKGQRLILLIDRDSLTVIKETGYKIFTGLAQGTIKVLRDPEAGLPKEEVAAVSPASTESGSGGELAAMPPLSWD